MVSAFIVFCEKKKVFGLFPFLACSGGGGPVAATTRTRPWRAGCFCFWFAGDTPAATGGTLQGAAPHWRKGVAASVEIEPNCLTLAQ